MVSLPVRRQQVGFLIERGISQRRACRLIGVARSALNYASQREVTDAPVIEAMKRLSAQYPRYGYRRIRIFLGREGHAMSPSRAERLWRKAKLQLPAKRRRKRISSSRPRPLPPRAANHVWAYDFVFDACANGQQVKCLSVVDEFTRECLAIDVAGSIRSGRVIETLARLMSERGVPAFIRSDNVLTVKSSGDARTSAGEDVFDAPGRMPLPSSDARGLPRSRRSPDLIIVNTRSGDWPRPCLKQHGVPWKVRTLSTGS